MQIKNIGLRQVKLAPSVILQPDSAIELQPDAAHLINSPMVKEYVKAGILAITGAPKKASKKISKKADSSESNS